MMNVKIFGERHTATNALTAFINKNFDTHTYYYDFLGWKHRRAPRKTEWQKTDYTNTLFIFTTRHPYTWVKSMHKEPYYWHHPQIKDLSLEQFMLHPFEDYEHILAMWNEKYQGYLDMSDQLPNSLFLRMEDFAMNPCQIYEELAKYLIPKTKKCIPCTEYVSGYGVSAKKLSAVANYQLSELQRDIINTHIDLQLMQQFSYPIDN